MKLYLAGPMTGYENFNYAAFEAAERGLRDELGHEVVSPREISLSHGSNDWAFCLRKDIEQMIYCDAVAVLQGWEKSRGARLECTIARALGLGFFRVHIPTIALIKIPVPSICLCLEPIDA